MEAGLYRLISSSTQYIKTKLEREELPTSISMPQGRGPRPLPPGIGYREFIAVPFPLRPDQRPPQQPPRPPSPSPDRNPRHLPSSHPLPPAQRSNETTNDSGRRSTSPRIFEQSVRFTPWILRLDGTTHKMRGSESLPTSLPPDGFRRRRRARYRSPPNPAGSPPDVGFRRLRHDPLEHAVYRGRGAQRARVAVARGPGVHQARPTP